MVPLGCGIVSLPGFEFRFQVPEADLLSVRTGQAHRTLLGHSSPVTCLQFDEIHIASGSLDKTLRVSVIHFRDLSMLIL
jgi:WD40 repeat protein